MGGITQAIEHALPKKQIYQVIRDDLYPIGLFNTGLGSTRSHQGILAPRTTELGAKLIDFLDKPLELK